MKKNNCLLIMSILIVLLVGEGYYLLKERSEKIALSGMLQKANMNSQASIAVIKGTKFIDNPLSKRAYLIAPIEGRLDAETQKAVTGWDVGVDHDDKGLLKISLIPTDTANIQQQFTLKSGYKLYFIRLVLRNNPTNGNTIYRGDILGVLVDQNGIIR